jgi:hypothetical protein
VAPSEHQQERHSILPSLGVMWLVSSHLVLAALQLGGQEQTVGLWAPAVANTRMPVTAQPGVASGGMATSNPISARRLSPTTMVSVSAGDANEWPQMQQPDMGGDHLEEPQVENNFVPQMLSLSMLTGALMYLWRNKRGGASMAMASATAGFVDKGVAPGDKSRHARNELYRQTRRTVFFYNDWRKSRSPSRWFKSLLTMPSSMVVRAVLREVFVISIVSVASCL